MPSAYQRAQIFGSAGFRRRIGVCRALPASGLLVAALYEPMYPTIPPPLRLHGRAPSGHELERRWVMVANRRRPFCICGGGGRRGRAAEALEDALGDLQSAGRSHFGPP